MRLKPHVLKFGTNTTQKKGAPRKARLVVDTIRNKSGKPDNVVACELVERKRTDCAKVSYSLDKTGIKKALKKRDSQIEELFEMEVVERFYVEPKTDKEVGE